jgi:hypothetical protein
MDVRIEGKPMTSTLTGTDITVSIDGGLPLPCELRVERQVIDVSSATARKPDMSWTFVDEAGHFHAFDHEGNLPTIVRREERVQPDFEDEGRDTDDDFYDDYNYLVTHIECGLCGGKVEPRYVADDPRKLIPGLIEYTLTVRGAVPSGRFSVLVTTPKRLFFGFGLSVSASVSGYGSVVFEPIHEVVCGPMSWRPAPEPREDPPADVWAGLRQRTEETQ